MGKTKVILLAVGILLVLATLSAIPYTSGWRLTLQEIESSVPNLQEPAQNYG